MDVCRLPFTLSQEMARRTSNGGQRMPVPEKISMISTTAQSPIPRSPLAQPRLRRRHSLRRSNQWYRSRRAACWRDRFGAVSAAGDLTFTPLVRGGSCCFRLPVSHVAQYPANFSGIAAAGSWVQNPLPGSSTQWATSNADGTRNGPVDRTALRHRDYLRRHCRTGRQSCVRMEFNSRIGPRHLFFQQKHGASWLMAMMPSVCLHRFTTLTFRKSSPAVET